jgi:DNA-binding SARP family transcriptional activator/tetratricopeptide (TPR) repeat protein
MLTRAWRTFDFRVNSPFRFIISSPSMAPHMQPPPFVLNCLGMPRLLTAGGQEVRIKVKKHLAVLVILAVDGGKIRRERLVSMLWPSARPDRARGSVATAISVLRAKLGGDAIEPARDWVQLVRGRVALDIDRLAKGEVLGDSFTPPLDVGAFLLGFEIAEVPEFEDWIGRQHAKLLPAIEKGLVTLSEHARRSGNLNELATYADRLLQINDLSEPGITARMQAYALSGDRVTALRVYDDWTRRLEQEVRAVPGSAIESLAGRLRGKGLDIGLAQSVSLVHTEQWRNQHFVGRSREYRLLYDAWQETLHGHTRNFLITGDSGVGKTTLADRFSTAVALEGASVARVRCFELESGIPFAMIGGVTSALLDTPGAAGTSPIALAELARVIPDVSKRFSCLPKPLDSTGEDARLRFVQALVQLFESILDEKPVLLVVDDYEQSDDVSLGAIHLLVRSLSTKRLMVVLTTRTGAYARRPDSLRLRSGVEDLGLKSLEVEPLGSAESESLLNMLVCELGLAPTATERSALLSAAGGFPLAIELMVRDWQVHGSRSTAFAIKAFTREVSAHPESRYQRLTESLLADLGETERLVVHTAAVLDRRVGDIGLYKVAGIAQVSVLSTLARLLERRALRDTPVGLEWVNPSVRAHAYLAIPAAIRSAIHDGVVDELLKRSRSGSKVPGLEMAWHSVRADRLREASAFLLEGAREALLAGAAREAELALLSGMSVFEGQAKQDAVLCLAEIWLELGQPEKAIDILKPLIEPLSEIESRATLLHLRAIVAAYNYGPNHPEMEKLTERLLVIGESSNDILLRARAVSLGVSLERGLSPSARSETLLNLGASIPLKALPPSDAVDLLSSMAKHYYYSRDIEPCDGLLRRAIEIADEAGIRNVLYLQALNGLGAVSCARGDYTSALDYSIQYHNAAQAAGVDRKTLLAAGNIALCLFRRGEYEQAIAWTEKINDDSPSSPHESKLTGCEVAGVSKALLGDKRGALKLVDKLLGFATSSPVTFIRRRSYLHAADILLCCSEYRKAREAGRQALAEGYPHDDDPGVLGRYARWMGSLVRSTSDLETLKEYLRTAVGRRLDWLDHVEVLTTLANHGLASPEQFRELESRRTALPAATLSQLAILSCLQPNSGWSMDAKYDGRRALLTPTPPEEKAIVGA